MNWLRIGIAVVITIIWATGYVLSYVGAAQAPTELTPVMLGVVGYLLTTEAKKKIGRTAKAISDMVGEGDGDGEGGEQHESA